MAKTMVVDDRRLPDGTEFVSWEKPLVFLKTYYVDNRSPHADDNGPGTRPCPFRTIGRAARVLQPGERVVIASGVYRESIHPERGGTGPQAMISYEATPGATVLVKGSVELKDGWRPSTGWRLRTKPGDKNKPRIWEIRLDGKLFDGYNPFGMLNILQDKTWLNYKRELNLRPFFNTRGLVFVDGRPLRQVGLYHQLADQDGSFWPEHHGLTLHVRLPDDGHPASRQIEITVREQVFAPRERSLGHIRLKGIIFEHAGNGFPVPQRGLVSTYRGHHWIIEDCTIQWANSVGLDVGNECWHAAPSSTPLGHHLIRRNTIRHCGICGLAGFIADRLLVEDNLIEHCGWQDA